MGTTCTGDYEQSKTMRFDGLPRVSNIALCRTAWSPARRRSRSRAPRPARDRMVTANSLSVLTERRRAVAGIAPSDRHAHLRPSGEVSHISDTVQEPATTFRRRLGRNSPGVYPAGAGGLALATLRTFEVVAERPAGALAWSLTFPAFPEVTSTAKTFGTVVTQAHAALLDAALLASRRCDAASSLPAEFAENELATRAARTGPGGQRVSLPITVALP